MSTLLAFDDVSRRYGAGENEIAALDHVSFAIDEGERVAIMGPSGCGKSTALNLLGGLDRPTSGAYRFRGVDTRTLDNDQLGLLRRHYIGFVFQRFQLLARTSSLENVELPLVYQRVDRDERRARAATALAEVGLSGREHHLPSELSGGQQQRVAIARALVSNPSLILADEPTGALDSARGREILLLLRELNERRGVTVVLVTHEPAAVEYVTRVICLRDGRLESDQRGAS